MLFFRSEEQVTAWCEARGVPRRPIVTLTQLWRLAQAWYANRLTQDARRPGVSEMKTIFAEIGLVGDFWDPAADVF